MSASARRGQPVAGRNRPSRLGLRDGHATMWTLLWPRARQAVRPNALGTGGLRAWVSFGFLGACMLWLVYTGGVRVLTPILTAPELGAVLGPKAINMFVLLVVSLMLVSGLVAAFTELLLARDLELLRNTPMRTERVFGARWVSILISSGWMSVALGTPLLAAFYQVAKGPWWSLAVGGVIGLSLIACVASSAMALALGIAVIAPARRVRDTISLLGLLMVAGGFLTIRALRPEQMASPEGYRDFTMFLAAMQTPSRPWSPAAWARTGLWQALHHEFDGVAIGAVVALAITLTALAGWCTLWLWDRAYRNAITGAGKQIARAARGRRADAWWIRQAGAQTGAVILTEWRRLVRDPAQWSHLALIFLLLGAYLYNAAVLPTTELGLARKALELALASGNAIVAAFVIAAVAGRFILPALTAELPMLWLYRTGPYAPRQLLVTKYWCGVLPLLGCAAVMHGGTSALLKVPVGLSLIGGALLLHLTMTTSALALAFGTRYPVLHAEHPAQAATSAAGMAYTALSLILIVLALAGHFPLAKAWVVAGPSRSFTVIPWSGLLSLALVHVALATMTWRSLRWIRARVDDTGDSGLIP